MKNVKLFSIILSSLLLAGCFDNVPSCDDSDVTQLVLKISKRELKKQIGVALASQIKIELVNIRPFDLNDKKNIHTCSAQIAMSSALKANIPSEDLPISYTIEVPDKDGNRNVNVYGL